MILFVLNLDLFLADFVEVENNHEPEEIFGQPKLIPVDDDECVTEKKEKKPIEEAIITTNKDSRSERS